MAFDNDLKRMAYFDQDSFTTQEISENNSVLHRLQLVGANHNSVPLTPYIKLDDKQFNKNNFGRGLNVFVIGPDAQYVAEKSFDTYGSAEVAISSMIEYIESFSVNHLVCIVSYDANRSNSTLDNWMSKVGSGSWPGAELIGRFYRSSIAMIYSTSLKKITHELFQLTAQPAGDTRVTLSVVFDDISDVGATGLPNSATDNPGELSFSDYNGPVFVEKPFTDLGLSKGDTLLCSYDVYTPAATFTAGAKARMSINFLKGAVWVSGDAKMSTKPDTWERFNFYVTIPNTDINTLQVKAFRYPSNITTGSVSVRNVSVTRVTRTDKKTGNAAIGVYGARLNNATEIPMPPSGSRLARLLNLPVADNPNSKFDLESTNFKEFQ